MVGQSVVLFVNRVPLRRFALCLALNGLLLTAVVAVWTISILALGRLFFGLELGLVRVFVLVGLSHAPLVLSVFEIVPHFGLAWGRLLHIWVFVAMVWAFSPWLGWFGSIVCCSGGGLTEAASRYSRLLGAEELQESLMSRLAGP